MSEKATASCLCGVVTWSAEGRFAHMSHCHCSRCRKAHGAPYATYAMVKADRFELTSGLDSIVKFDSSPGCARPFCRHCGSVVPDGVPWHGQVTMPAGCFDTDPGIRPQMHIFVASKAPWVEIHDELPRYDAYPESVQAPVVADLDREGEGAPIHGSCLCGGVRYEVTGQPLRCRTCHCSRCRKAGSSLHVSYLVTAMNGVRITRGDELRVTFGVPGARYFKHVFCGACGSSVPRFDAERDIAIVPMGTLDVDPGIRPQCHIFVASIAPWDVITDALPTYPEHAP